MKAICLLVCTALICLHTAASAEEFSGKVIAVMDGDTVLALRDGHPVKIRFAEIDAPEKAQPYGDASRKSLAEMVKGQQIRVISTAVDDYGRLIAKVRVGEINVNYEQVRRGLAWEYSRFHGNHELVALQHEAQQAKRGLWAEAGAIEPSQWRKQHASALPEQPPASSSQDSGSCGKKHCSEISSCEDALRSLSLCGQKSLDGDADGKPCEKLCAPAKDKAVSNK